jgi:hypothetical protein
MINLSKNLFNADILEVFADGEQIGTIKIVRELEEYEAKNILTKKANIKIPTILFLKTFK